MEAIIYKLSELQFMQTVELEEYIFPTDYIVKNNSLHNSSFFCQFKNNSDLLYSQYIYV
jgi:hypothetical protein